MQLQLFLVLLESGLTSSFIMTVELLICTAFILGLVLEPSAYMAFRSTLLRNSSPFFLAILHQVHVKKMVS
ncbi:hypothetical protein KSP39_PZI020730 [Platanthera zijinensis]|uniref:Uncharacterized protein n=1 Tax=Platanthera zijinensis TaxID=2320716 RepID=A0AAP0FX47_9ASPA